MSIRVLYDMQHDSGDPWGSAMSAFFDIAHELTRRSIHPPTAWEFRCSPLGPGEPEGVFAECITEASTDDLVRFGNVLNRYTNRLRLAGRDY